MPRCRACGAVMIGPLPSPWRVWGAVQVSGALSSKWGSSHCCINGLHVVALSGGARALRGLVVPSAGAPGWWAFSVPGDISSSLGVSLFLRARLLSFSDPGCFLPIVGSATVDVVSVGVVEWVERAGVLCLSDPGLLRPVVACACVDVVV